MPGRNEGNPAARVSKVNFSMATVNRRRLGTVYEQLLEEPGHTSQFTLNDALAAVLDHWFATHPKDDKET